ncbi:unnamed protein product [Paramecium sonneborni]|uniref:IBR domain-containing protein n=1 Tax=Paramecium sonneborni TaxID=65129 RepID=A0A8S1RMD7_9CILI|nr:unnamed protein product [Paramecium sonneborni]
MEEVLFGKIILYRVFKANGKIILYKRSIQILEIKDVIKVIEKDMLELQDVLGLKIDIIFELLMQFNWNLEEVIQKYFSNQEALLIKLKSEGIYKDHDKINENGHKGTCSVCFCDGNLIRMDSQIWYYNKAKNFCGQFLIVKCLQNGCNYRIPFQMLKRYSNPEFDNLLSRRYVDSSKSLVYCTGVNCNKILKLTLKSIKEVTCESCQNIFCFYCKEDPFCKKPVERSEGCNYMMCKPPGGCCKAFCYVCSQPWKPDHKDHFKCKKYISQIFEHYEFTQFLIQSCIKMVKSYQLLYIQSKQIASQNI